MNFVIIIEFYMELPWVGGTFFFLASGSHDRDGRHAHIGLFQKKITFLVRKFQKFCVWLLTLYAFIICQVIIRKQYYTNAS